MTHMKFNHLPLSSLDGTQLNLDALYKIAPSCFTEARDEKTGALRHVVDFKKLRQLLGDNAVEDEPEAYEFTWVGKNAARREAATPINKTLRPVPESSVDWDHTQNIYIEGDNLDALKLLQKSYLGKVKMIYIDPPYNTGNDFVYHDDFHRTQAEEDLEAGNVDELGNRFVKNTETNGKFHSDWCSMIYPRLQLAHTLLSEDGVIFISIDDKEVSNLIKIANELFGEYNFIGDIVWQSRTSISNDDVISTNHNHTLVYSKEKEHLTFGGDDIDESEYINPDNDPRGPWKLVPIDANHVGGDTNYPIVNPKTGVKYYPPNGRIWCYSKETLKQLMNDNRIKFGLRDDSSPKRKLFLNERKGKGDSKTPSSILLDAGTTKTGTTEIMALFDNQKVFDYPKPTTLIERLVQYGFVKNNDIVLDFFSGSGTTGQALWQYSVKNRFSPKFILVQLQEDLDESLKTANNDAKKTIRNAIFFLDSIKKSHKITELAEERLRRAGKKIQDELKAKQPDLFDNENGQPLDIGFRVFRIDSSNMKDVYFAPKDLDPKQLDLFADNVKEDRTELDLLYGCMVDWGLQLSLPLSMETIDGVTVYTVNNGDLVACFGKPITADVVKAMASKAPLRILFRDSCFEKDEQKINIYERFKQLCNWNDDEALNKIRVI